MRSRPVLFLLLLCGAANLPARAAAPDLGGTWHADEKACPVELLFLNLGGDGYATLRGFVQPQADIDWSVKGDRVIFDFDDVKIGLDGVLKAGRIESTATFGAARHKTACTFEPR